MTAALMLVAGLVVLPYSADRFVLGAARLSTALRVSPVVVGVVILGFGTTAPEFLVSTLAALQGAQDIAFGNLVGSNITNVLLVLGAAAVITPISVSVQTLRREIPMMLVAVCVLAAVTFDRRATVGAGVVLLLTGVAVSVFLWRAARADRGGVAILQAGIEEYEQEEHPRVGPSLVLLVLGLAGTVGGAQLLVLGATQVARAVGVSEAVIGLTVVAIGTSLPELTTAVAAARRKQVDLVVGNILGANLYNSLPIAGLAAIIGGTDLDPAFPVSLLMMLGACFLAGLFLFTGNRLSRFEGVVLLLLFAGTLLVTTT